MWRARFFQAIPRVIEAYPNARWVFLTLTVKNCPVNELKSTLGLMNKAWVRLTQRKQFPAIGFVKSTEVTRSDNGDAHPHFHVLMLVSSRYFGDQYIKQGEWRELWQQALRADYLPVVNVKAVKSRPGDPTNGVAIALLETLKYGVKESDLMHDAAWLQELTKQLHKTRAVSVGGVLKAYLSEEEPDDLIHADDGQVVAEPDTPQIWFGWREMVKRYVKE
jgi:plasmid rolling circle replication initiator protein Rep